MNDLILDNLIKEKRDITNISYILEESSLFFETGYKVLQNQEKNGFIKAVKVIHNGKIKLIYDIFSFILPETDRTYKPDALHLRRVRLSGICVLVLQRGDFGKNGVFRFCHRL